MKHNGPDDEHSWILAKLVLLSTRFEVNLTLDSVAQIDLPVDHVGECGCARICKIKSYINNAVPIPPPKSTEIRKLRTLKVSHESLCSAVQSVDDHLPVSWTGNFDTSVLETRSGWYTVP